MVWVVNFSLSGGVSSNQASGSVTLSTQSSVTASGDITLATGTSATSGSIAINAGAGTVECAYVRVWLCSRMCGHGSNCGVNFVDWPLIES